MVNRPVKQFLLFLLFAFLFPFAGIIKLSSASPPLKSSYGHMINPHGQYRILTLFINIIYDETPHVDPIKNPNSTWPAPTEKGINIDLPGYLNEFLDTKFFPDGAYGSMTRIYRESSFDRLVLLGDFMVVNVKQSDISKTNDRFLGHNSGSFSLHALVNAAINQINAADGLKAIFGHNAISDYDNFTPEASGVFKPMQPNGKIDFIQILTRNTTYVDTTFVNNRDTISHRLQFGQLRSGQGWGNFKPRIELKMNGAFFGYDLGTIQCVGDVNITDNPTNIVHHEFSHNLFGGNNFHASGGNHYTGGGTNTFFGVEGGYGLMGSYHSGLVSCNGYERWRMHWTSPVYNPEGYPVQANQIPSDISREDGPMSFVLRDFVTTGDAIRIKLPYKDPGASNQYIWLENHQVGLNNKLDYLQYSLDFFGNTLNPCRHNGTPGIYAFLQVGKDVIEGPANVVFPWNETDNLRIISAEGNWDFLLMDGEYSCVAYGYDRRTERRFRPNPLSGYQDQTTHFFPPEGQDVIRRTDGDGIAIKYFSEIGNDKDVSYSYYGDSLDAFTGKTHMNIGTNPSPVNATTFYVNQFHEGQNNHVASNQNTNTSHIYLTGLRIDMEALFNGDFLVKIVWDDYAVANNVSWAGNIVVREKVIVAENQTISLKQSLTPNQITRDPESGLFAKTTVLRFEDQAAFILKNKSKVLLTNRSALILKSGSLLQIGDGAELVVGPGDTLRIEPSASLIVHGNGKLRVSKGGVLCVSEDAVISAHKGRRNFKFQRGHNIPQKFIDPRKVLQN
jgi:hypothetical protein